MGTGSDDWTRRHEADTAVAWRRQSRAFAVRTARLLARDRSALFWAFAWPTFWYAITSALFVDAPADPGAVKAAIAVSYGAFGATSIALIGMGTTVSSDRTAARYRMLRALPVSPSADVAGRAVALTGFGLASFLAVLAVGALDGARYVLVAPWSVPVVVASVVAMCLVAVLVGLAFAELLGRREHVAAVGTVALLLSYYATGFYGAQPTFVPAAGRWVVNVLPTTLGTRLAISALVPGAGSHMQPAVPPVALAVAAVVLAGLASFGAAVGLARVRPFAAGGEA